jgi:A/G-specific adenine glycosylase
MKDQLAPALLAWWDRGHDAFPWRETRDPYAIWVSEVMLQQTQASTVVPYFERWMATFPTVTSLACAPLGAVLKAWQGLGYYSRARNLHQAAIRLDAEWGGELPEEVALLGRLPGIGRYTAGAIASIAFGRRAAVVDGNVIRVLARVYDLEDDVTLSATVKRLWEMADSLLPADRPGDYNQALMELGRKICRPVQPLCHYCPLAELCQARRAGTQLDRPVRRPRKRTPHYSVTAGVIWRGDRVLIAQRPLDGRLGGLWEFPGGKQEKGESLEECLSREIREELAIEIYVGERLTTIEHGYTHFRITLHVFECRHQRGEPQAIGVADLAWVSLDELDDYAFPVTDQKIVRLLNGQGGGQR